MAAELITLRGGATTTDPRLDRVYPGVEEHLSSLNYLAVKGTPLEQKPFRSYTWNVGCHLDQGQEGRCVEYGICHELASRPVCVEEGVINDILSRKAIYWPAQERDKWPGGSYPGGTPVYEGTSVLAGAQVAAELGFYDEYRWGLDVDDLARMVGYKGPAVIGVDWYEDMSRPDQDGFIHATGKQTGGHCILVHGVKVSKHQTIEYFKLWNSWGPDWGQNGTCKLSCSDMAKLIAAEGEVMLPVRRKR